MTLINYRGVTYALRGSTGDGASWNWESIEHPIDEGPCVGPFTSRAEAIGWARREGCQTH